MCQFALSKEAIEEVHAIDFARYFAPELENVYRPTRDKAIEQIAAWIG